MHSRTTCSMRHTQKLRLKCYPPRTKSKNPVASGLKAFLLGLSNCHFLKELLWVKSLTWIPCTKLFLYHERSGFIVQRQVSFERWHQTRLQRQQHRSGETAVRAGAPQWCSGTRAHLRCRSPGFDPQGRGVPLQEKTATHSSILAWRTHGKRSPRSYSPKGPKDWATEHTLPTWSALNKHSSLYKNTTYHLLSVDSVQLPGKASVVA